jgi:hypothetical protein
MQTWPAIYFLGTAEKISKSGRYSIITWSAQQRYNADNEGIPQLTGRRRAIEIGDVEPAGGRTRASERDSPAQGYMEVLIRWGEKGRGPQERKTRTGL